MDLNTFKNWALSQGSVDKVQGSPNSELKGQCVSLINQGLYKMHGILAGAWGHAKTWADPNNPIRQYFDVVQTSKPGDIGIDTRGTYGHIWWYLDNAILEQNGAKALKVTVSPDRNASLILRRKGTPQSQGGGDMPTKVDTGLLRIIHSEMEGWDYEKTHRGDFDAQFLASWGGANLVDVIWEKWNKNAPFRNNRERNRKFYEQYAAIVGELGSRPTNAQYAEALEKLKVESDKVLKAQSEAEAARQLLLEEQAKKTQDSKDMDEASSNAKGLWGFILKLLNRK